MSDFESAIRTLARKYALENAAKFGGKATPGAVVGKVMAEAAEHRARAKEIPLLVQSVVDEVNALSPEVQASHFAAVKDTLVQREKKVQGGPLRPLANATKGKVVLRLAPNPSGPPHFGHGRGMIITDAYKRMYDGKFILRFDDTDTTVKPPWMPAYDMFQETLEWLTGHKADRVIFASDHMETYTDWALELVHRGGGYVCECVAEVFRALKEKGEPCPHRGQSPDDNEEKFKRMVDGGYRRGAAVLRVKTDIAHKDPAMRDWVAFRIAEEPHPRLLQQGKEQYHAWPLLDFQSAIDDHLEGVTHIIRGKDLRDSTSKQEFLYAHLGWTYPETTYWGRVSVHEFGKFSKSILTKAIEAGEYTGWDDPRLPTFPALRRRGFTPQGIQNFWLNFGITEKDIAASIVTLEAENKKIIEPIAHRAFFVPDPVELRLEGDFPKEIQPALLPDAPEAGTRPIPVDASVLLSRGDVPAGGAGPLRLKDLGNAILEDGVLHHEGNDLQWMKQRRAPIVQWVPANHGVPTTLVMPDASQTRGMSEPHLRGEKVGAPVQLERVGFARVDEHRADGSLVLYYTHK